MQASLGVLLPALAFFFVFKPLSQEEKNSSAFTLQATAVFTNTQPTSTPLPQPTASDAVALINGRSLTASNWRQWQQANRVMATLLALPPTDPQAELDQFINSQLVWRDGANQQTPTPTETDAYLQQLLTRQGHTKADLKAVLAAHDMAEVDFITHYGRLLAIDAHSRRQSQAANQTVADYIRSLQTQNQISIGPALQPTAPPLSAPTAVAVNNSPPQPTSVPSTTNSAPTNPPPDPANVGTSPGQSAPAFTLQPLTGDTAVALADFAGQPVVLSFWTTWCPYCRAQTPALVAASQAQADQIQFLGINVQEETAVVAGYAADADIPYPILLDTQRQVADSYQVTGFPTTYFLNAQGQIVSRHIGQITTEQLSANLQKIMATP